MKTNMKSGNHNHLRQKGLTLIELLISMVVMLLIMAGLVSAFISHNSISSAEAARMEVQQDLRVAVDRLKNVLRNAGYGCHASFAEGNTMIGTEPQGGSITIGSSISHISNQKSVGTDINSDSLITAYGFKNVGKTVDDDALNADQIKLDKDPSPSITTGGFKNYLSFFPHPRGNNFFVVTAVDGRKITLSEEVSVEQDTDVFMVSPSRIEIAEDSGISVLYIKNFAYTSSIHWIVAENIIDLQFQYFIPGQGWQDEPSLSDVNQQKIRKIRFWVLGKSREKVPNAGQQQFQVEDPETQEIIYQVGPFNDGHIYMISQGEVALRNAR